MKQINACWLKRIKSLREILNELDAMKIKRGELFLKLVDLTKELDHPNLLMDTDPGGSPGSENAQKLKFS
jgi:hypothetical protein